MRAGCSHPLVSDAEVDQMSARCAACQGAVRQCFGSLAGIRAIQLFARFNNSIVTGFILFAVTIELFNRQPEAYADAANNVRLRLTVKRNTVPRTACKVAESAQAVR